MTPAMPRISPACSVKLTSSIGAGEAESLGLEHDVVARRLLQRLAVVFGVQPPPDHQAVQHRARRPPRPASSATTAPSFMT